MGAFALILPPVISGLFLLAMGWLYAFAYGEGGGGVAAVVSAFFMCLACGLMFYAGSLT